jgi:hypothetical protein
VADGFACLAFAYRPAAHGRCESTVPCSIRRASACFSGCKPLASGWNASTQARSMIFSPTANGRIWYFFLSLFVSRNPLNAAACRRTVCTHGRFHGQ